MSEDEQQDWPPFDRPQHPPMRASVQGTWRIKDGLPGHDPGTITWEEHERAWMGYDAKWHCGQSALRIHERGGFCYEELVEFLEHAPATWEPARGKE